MVNASRILSYLQSLLMDPSCAVSATFVLSPIYTCCFFLQYWQICLSDLPCFFFKNHELICLTWAKLTIQEISIFVVIVMNWVLPIVILWSITSHTWIENIEEAYLYIKGTELKHCYKVNHVTQFNGVMLRTSSLKWQLHLKVEVQQIDIHVFTYTLFCATVKSFLFGYMFE